MGRIDLSIVRQCGRRRRPIGNANTPEIEGQLSDDQATDIYKDYDLYLAAKNGNLDDFARILDRISAEDNLSVGAVLWRISPGGNTFLHVAAKHGNVDIVTYIAAKDSSLIFKRNLDGDTALHLAAKFGDESTVKALVLSKSDEAETRSDLLRAQNERGNTALHQAILNQQSSFAGYLIREDRDYLNNLAEYGLHLADDAALHHQSSIAEYLIGEDPELLYYSNNQEEYGLYLAAKANCVSCVASILKSSTDHERINDQFKKKSPIEVAISNNNLVILEMFLYWDPSFIKFRDHQGKTPLHYAAASGSLQMVSYLLKEHAPNAPQKDNNGLLPIHLATIRGHIDIISLFLRSCPDPGELLDREDRNVLHIAAKNGRYNVVMYILDNPDLAKLINMKDRYGEVPLHLATINWHPTIVSALTWDKRVDVTLVNDEGLTALDAAEDHLDYNPTFRQRLTWSALKSAGTPRSPSRKTLVKSSTKNSNGENYKERVNTLLLVSTLVATITFAAGFTLPGGYNNSDTDLGMATMLRRTGFHIFVFCDSIAMYSSIVVAVTLVWAQLGDLNLVLTALNLALPLLGISLTMMSMAFTAGIYLVVSKLRWLSIAVLVLGFSFLAILLVLLLPLCMPLTSSNRIIRHICYYPFCLLVLATRSYSQDKMDARENM